MQVGHVESLILFVADLGEAGRSMSMRWGCRCDALARGLTVLWPAQEAAWGRFVVLADPDGRSVVLARMKPVPA